MVLSLQTTCSSPIQKGGAPRWVWADLHLKGFFCGQNVTASISMLAEKQEWHKPSFDAVLPSVCHFSAGVQSCICDGIHALEENENRDRQKHEGTL
jgi:hypothetical protein